MSMDGSFNMLSRWHDRTQPQTMKLKGKLQGKEIMILIDMELVIVSYLAR